MSDAHSVSIHAYCLLPKTLSLLMKPEENNLPQAMQWLFSRYAKAFNQRNGRVGHLFSGPYGQAIFVDKPYIIASSAFIHLMPGVEGLSESPSEYRWSSCRQYLSGKPVKSSLDASFVLDLLDGGSEGKNREMYSQLLAQCAEMAPGADMGVEEFITRFRHHLAKSSPFSYGQLDMEGYHPDFPGSHLMGINHLESRSEEIRMGCFTNGCSTQTAKKQLAAQFAARGYRRAHIAEQLGISVRTVYGFLRELKEDAMAEIR